MLLVLLFDDLTELFIVLPSLCQLGFFTGVLVVVRIIIASAIDRAHVRRISTFSDDCAVSTVIRPLHMPTKAEALSVVHDTSAVCVILTVVLQLSSSFVIDRI